MPNQKDNRNPDSKIKLREWLLDKLGGAPECRVLELFGGQGVLHDACYTKVKAHLAFDLKKVNRPTWLRGDNRVLLHNRVNGWDLYDLDAYAIPWQLAYDIARMRSPGVFGMVVTCGMPRSFCTGHVHPFIRKKAGLGGMDFNGCGILLRYYDDIVRIMLTEMLEKYGVRVLEAKRDWANMKAPHSSPFYFAFLMEKQAPKAPTSNTAKIAKAA